MFICPFWGDGIVHEGNASGFVGLDYMMRRSVRSGKISASAGQRWMIVRSTLCQVDYPMLSLCYTFITYYSF